MVVHNLMLVTSIHGTHEMEKRFLVGFRVSLLIFSEIFIQKLYKLWSTKDSQYLIIIDSIGSTSQNANNEIMRKPTRLEAMPTVDVRKNSRKRSNGPLLNTMGTF